MTARRVVALALLTLAAAAPTALANNPVGNDPSPGDTTPGHVHRAKAWRARFEYQMERNVPAHDELNGRADVIAKVLKGQWWKIDCQLYDTTQNGQILWDHVPNVGWIFDGAIRTYYDGRIPGSPTCAMPGPNHVWFQQPWAAAKEYRLARSVLVRTRPAGAARPGESRAASTWTTIACSARMGGRAWVQLYDRRKYGQGWIPALALRFWQKGLPAGLPRCQGDAVPTYYVALGDSYAAGIGAGSYYDQPDTDRCRRSAKAYWALLEQQLRPGVDSELSDFEACSGDTTSDLLSKLGALNRDTSLVTLSIGGNDMHFSDVVRGCVEPGGSSCKDEVARHITPATLQTLRDHLDTVYRAVRTRAPRARILVMGYPELVPRDHIDGCGAMDDGDAPVLHHAAVLVNGAIKDTVGVRPGFRFVGLVKTFLGHPACNSRAADWINGVTTLADGKASFHPNVQGNIAIAARIKAVAPHFFR